VSERSDGSPCSSERHTYTHTHRQRQTYSSLTAPVLRHVTCETAYRSQKRPILLSVSIAKETYTFSLLIVATPYPYSQRLLATAPFEFVDMGWLQLVGSMQLQVSFAKEPCCRSRIWYTLRDTLTVPRLLKITGLFCKRALQKRLYSAKETYNSKEPLEFVDSESGTVWETH